MSMFEEIALVKIIKLKIIIIFNFKFSWEWIVFMFKHALVRE